jgi:hypothetical protein
MRDFADLSFLFFRVFRVFRSFLPAPENPWPTLLFLCASVPLWWSSLGNAIEITQNPCILFLPRVQLLCHLWPVSARLAQRKSTSLTRKGSQVQVLHRAPFLSRAPMLLLPGLPKTPIKLMFVTSGAAAAITLVLVLIALSLGLERRGDGGYPWLEAAFCVNAPGAVVFTGVSALVLAITGRLSEIPDLTFIIASASISVPIYGLAGLWLGVLLQRRSIRKTSENLPHSSHS